MSDRRLYWMWLSHICGQGSKTAVELIRIYGNPEKIFNTSVENIKADFPKIDGRKLARMAKKNIDEEKDILRWCDNNGVMILTPDSEKYPDSLLGLLDAPMALYALGQIPDYDNSFFCAVVGTRNMTDYGKRMAYKIGAGLADGGAYLVSGLALGIDGMAMAGALEAGGRCAAVLGCGIDIIYPKEHKTLLRKAIEKGFVITEYAPGVSPEAHHFPVRNRLISGLSQAVCVVEGNMKSGSLITARHAGYQGRTVFALPGEVDESNSSGTNSLLKHGAKLITGAEDILSHFEFMYPHVIKLNSSVPHISADDAAQDYGISKRKNKSKKPSKDGVSKTEKSNSEKKKEKEKQNNDSPFPDYGEKKQFSGIDFESLSEQDMKVYNFMKDDVPMIADEITKCGLTVSQILMSMTMLEIAGAVEAGAGGYYLKRAADANYGPEYITEDDEVL